MSSFALLRFSGLLAAASLLGACQDTNASNPDDRETHMGDIHAASPAPTVSASAAAPATAAPVASAPTAPAPAAPAVSAPAPAASSH